MRSSIFGLAILGVAVALPAVLGNYPLHLVNLALIAVISAVGLYFIIGLTGQISLCHASFAGISAYAMTLLATKFGVPFWLGWPAGALLAGAAGYLIGIPALRLQGHYLALATLGFGEILLLGNVHFESLTNGPNGLAVPPPSIGGYAMSTVAAKYFLVLATAALAILVAWNIRRSHIGRVLIALHDNPTAAQSAGVHLAHYKTLAFALGSFYSGVAGGLYAVVVGFITPYEFGLWPSLWTLVIVVLGGMGQLAGVVLSAVVVTALPEVLRGFQNYQDLVFGIILLAVLIYKPSGLYGLVDWARRSLGLGPGPVQNAK